MNPAVSVIVPFRGRIPWVREAVDSVLAQSIGNFEIILVDDGSEESASFLNEFQDDRIRYIRQNPSGPAAARNSGIRVAMGKYIAFLDSDDLFLPDKLEIQLRLMEERPDIVFSHTSYVRMDVVGKDLERIDSGKFTGRVYPRIVTHCPIATPTVMVRRDILGELNFEESVRVGEDVILWTQIARSHDIMGIDRPLTRVRVHGRNAFAEPGDQYHGNMNILRHAFRNDRSFNAEFRREAFVRICKAGGNGYLMKGEKREALKCFLKGLSYRPLDSEMISNLIRLIVPERARPALRRIRDRIKPKQSLP
jgi:glycosyltransferase involved in cell wall biosynthesis